MPFEPLYRRVDENLCQGDIFALVPHLLLKDLPTPLKRTSLPRNRTGFEAELLAEDQLPSPGVEVVVPTTCVVARGMLLSYDCDLDNDKKHRTLAMIRPLAGIPADVQQIIRENRNFSFFHLPQGGDLPESYVDFRRISTIAPRFTDRARRLHSLSESARKAMLLQFFRFFTRIELDAAVFEVSPEPQPAPVEPSDVDLAPPA